jgi:hypothetical protein
VDYIDIDLPGALAKNRILMLDILANNDWERPIYFSGGSFDDAEYLWMKEYLQLDGMAYKLVPIRTTNRSPFEMGRIDSELMYDKVMAWEWGNSGSGEIYHDPQTRSQGLSLRSNLARLTEQLISENKIDKAREVIDLAMTNMPLEDYGFYTFAEPFLDGYYKTGETLKARELFGKLRNIYKDRLEYYENVPLDQQYDQIEDILADMEAYKRVIDIAIENDDRELAEKETPIFNEQLDKFGFYQDTFLKEVPQMPESEQPPAAAPDSIGQDAVDTEIPDTISVSESQQ